jgi:hypothetical protein
MIEELLQSPDILQLLNEQNWPKLGVELIRHGITLKQVKPVTVDLIKAFLESAPQKSPVDLQAGFTINFMELATIEAFVEVTSQYISEQHKHLLKCPHTEGANRICVGCHHRLSELMVKGRALPEPYLSYSYALYTDANPHARQQGSVGNLVSPDERSSVEHEATWRAIKSFDEDKAGNAAAMPHYINRSIRNQLKDVALCNSSGLDGTKHHQRMAPYIGMIVKNFEAKGIVPTDMMVREAYMAATGEHFSKAYVTHLLFGTHSDIYMGLQEETYDKHQQRALEFLSQHAGIDEGEIVSLAMGAWNKPGKSQISIEAVRLFRNLTCISIHSKVDNAENQTIADCVPDIETVESAFFRKYERETAEQTIQRALDKKDRLSVAHQNGLELMMACMKKVDEEREPDDLSRYNHVPSNVKWYLKLSQRVTNEMAKKAGFIGRAEAEKVFLSKEFHSAIYMLLKSCLV